ncbi:MAG: diaminopimelate decarboxylase [Actinobacteria bacterium]|nr:diaminopimelate decarboxylase [Actinomycetota bacterium]
MTTSPGRTLMGVPGPDDPIGWHLLPDSSSVLHDGHLAVGGVDLVDLASEVGTPLFVYDEAHIRRRCREAVEAFGEGVAYGSKAFLCKAMARLVFEEGMGIDVASGGEMQVALAAGVSPSKLVLHGNNKSYEELSLAFRAGLGRIVVDSFDEIDRISVLLDELSTSSGAVSTKFLIRVTPGVEAHTHEYVRTGQDDSKFGFSLASGAAAEAWKKLRHIVGEDLVGVHAHIGSQIFLLDSYVAEVEVLSSFLANHPLEELCIGGGLGVAYLNGERAPSLSQWAEVVRDACTRMGIPPQTRITAEPGRSIVASSAITLYRIGTVKHLPGIRTYVAVDGGMSDNPRPVLYGSGYEAFLPRSVHSRRPVRVTVVGKHCESGDVVVNDARLPSDFHVGDVLATPVTGAYGYSMASNYNRVPRPPVIFVKDGQAKEVLRRETIEDMLQLDIG